MWSFQVSCSLFLVQDHKYFAKSQKSTWQHHEQLKTSLWWAFHGKCTNTLHHPCINTHAKQLFTHKMPFFENILGWLTKINNYFPGVNTNEAIHPLVLSFGFNYYFCNSFLEMKFTCILSECTIQCFGIHLSPLSNIGKFSSFQKEISYSLAVIPNSISPQPWQALVHFSVFTRFVY